MRAALVLGDARAILGRICTERLECEIAQVQHAAQQAYQGEPLVGIQPDGGEGARGRGPLSAVVDAVDGGAARLREVAERLRRAQPQLRRRPRRDHRLVLGAAGEQLVEHVEVALVLALPHEA